MMKVFGVFARAGAPKMPYWAQVTVIPLLNIFVALALAGCVVLLLGENPFKAMAVMLQGAFVYPGGLGFTLYYTTNLIFTGLCVAMAFHAMQFNIGGEGQAIIGGLGVALFLLFVGDSLPLIICLPLAVLAAAAAGGAWAFIPGYLYAKRGSHIVITTIMFNFIAAAMLQYLLVNVLIAPGQMSPQSVKFAERTHLPQIHELLALVGIETESTPLNISLFLALAAAVGFWFLIWRTSWGYALRTVGQSERAAVYAGIDPARMTVQAMAISGALAGMVGVNALMGDAHRILLGFATGYGFAGIGVALMGRNHPLGIVLAAALFGILTQGGSELNFEFRNITRDLVIVIQGLIILMVGALSLMLDPPVARLIALLSRRKEDT